MTATAKPSPARLYAALMIGAGLVVIGIALFLLLYNPAASSTELLAVPAKVDFAAPKLNLEDLSGKPVSLDDYLGSVVLVNLWATWCPPCREEMPALQAFYEDHKTEGFVLVAINQEESHELVEPFVKEFGLTFPIWMDSRFCAPWHEASQSLCVW